jgi:hypothetical protein
MPHQVAIAVATVAVNAMLAIDARRPENHMRMSTARCARSMTHVRTVTAHSQGVNGQGRR